MARGVLFPVLLLEENCGATIQRREAQQRRAPERAKGLVIQRETVASGPRVEKHGQGWRCVSGAEYLPGMHKAILSPALGVVGSRK